MQKGPLQPVRKAKKTQWGKTDIIQNRNYYLNDALFVLLHCDPCFPASQAFLCLVTDQLQRSYCL